ncbi:MAG: glycosyltransferase family 4 protein [Candidatus Hodarchaeaceae archaeon]|nr:glycosyltransferase family 4 protein [Candidatus Hodarchaeaceae archaeon]
MMKGLNLCLNSQTPLIRFKLQYAELLEKYGELPDPTPLDMLIEGEDYEMSPGGVPKIVYPLMNRMIKENLVENAHWVSLNPIGPERVAAGKILVHNISLDPHELPAYSRMKERIWEEVHDLERHKIGPREFSVYAKYNWLCATKMFELLPIDVFYIHDFQQLQIGNMIGLAAPTVFRWHIPLDLTKVDPYMRNFIVRCMEAFDAVVVSCKRDLEGLIRAGYHGKAYQIYPYVDDERWKEPTSSEMDKFCSTFGIGADDRVVLVVGRMDKIKGQDTVVNAMHQLTRETPNLKLMLVGDGSFSGSAVGGLSHPKANVWRRQLQKLVSDLKLEKNVVFTGYLPDELLRAAYKRAEVIVLPSIKEGFGLVVGEAWYYKKPVVVSKGAGASEMVIEGTNGYTFEAGDVKDLASKLNLVLKNPEAAAGMGERGKEMVKVLSLEEGVKKVSAIFTEAIEGFKKK